MYTVEALDLHPKTKGELPDGMIVATMESRQGAIAEGARIAPLWDVVTVISHVGEDLTIAGWIAGTRTI